MLIINKELSEVRLIVTVSEQWKSLGNAYRLFMHSAFTGKEYSIILPTNTSPYTQRYDEFVVPTSGFTAMEPGMYSYTIYESTDGSEDHGILQQGVLKVIDVEQPDEQYIYITDESTDDDFIVYNPNS